MHPIYWLVLGIIAAALIVEIISKSPLFPTCLILSIIVAICSLFQTDSDARIIIASGSIILALANIWPEAFYDFIDRKLIWILLAMTILFGYFVYKVDVNEATIRWMLVTISYILAGFAYIVNDDRDARKKIPPVQPT